MSDGAVRFIARYPVVWHVIEADGAGPWLPTMGLLPTAILLKLAGIVDDGANREQFRRLELGLGRVAVIRPQLMPDARLLPTLAGSFAGRPAVWRRHINAHVFFWTEPRRRDSFLRACVRFRRDADPPRVLTIDTATLLARHEPHIFYARINTGSTVRGGARVRRDETTLAPIASYRSGPVAELAIAGPVALDGWHQQSYDRPQHDPGGHAGDLRPGPELGQEIAGA